MKNHHSYPLSGVKNSRAAQGFTLAALLFATSLNGQVVKPLIDKVDPSPRAKPVSAQAVADVPPYGVAAAPVAEVKPIAMDNEDIVYLTPLVVNAHKQVELNRLSVLNRRAFSREILKEYDYSAFSLYQHREAVQLQDRETLQDYAANLLLIGDVAGSRALTRQSSPLFLRSRDAETVYIDQFLNSRAR